MSRRRLLAASIAAGLALGAGQAAAAEPVSAPAAATPGKPATIHVVYIENELRAPGLAVSSERDDTLVDYRYFELGRYLKERAPLVFAANGVAGDVTIVTPPPAGAELTLDFPAGEPIVTLTATSFSKRTKLFQSWATVNFTINVLRPAAAGAPRTGRTFQNLSVSMGPDPVLGVMRIHRLEPGFVDSVMVDLLNDLAAKGDATLPAAKAVRPPPAG
jgi:hypothetical protein